MECRSLRESGAVIRRFDVSYFAASVDEPEKNRRFAEELELDYPILSDPGKQVALAYGVLLRGLRFASRATFFIGKDGKILAVDRDVEPARHGRAIAAKLAELKVSPRLSPPAASAPAAAAPAR